MINFKQPQFFIATQKLLDGNAVFFIHFFKNI